MKVLILDDMQKRVAQMQEELEKKNIEAVECLTSNCFLDSLNTSEFDSLLLNVETWEKGRSIYDYFRINKKLENTPIVFYNADEAFTSLNHRTPHDKDQILYKPSDVDSVIGAL
ncbi:MAG: hypothetical protein ACLFVQ_01200 [Chitinispirillaceae bacterium]